MKMDEDSQYELHFIESECIVYKNKLEQNHISIFSSNWIQSHAVFVLSVIRL